LLKTVLLLFSAANLKHCRNKKKLKTCIFFRNRSRNRSLFPQSFPMYFIFTAKNGFEDLILKIKVLNLQMY